MARHRNRSRSIEVECVGEVDIDDFDTEVLIESLQRRDAYKRKREGPDADLVSAYEAVKRGRSDEAVLILEKYLWPKWSAIEDCMEALAKIKKVDAHTVS